DFGKRSEIALQSGRAILALPRRREESMRSIGFPVLCAVAAMLVGAAAAQADTMHPQLGARLSGVGEHGVVNLQPDSAERRLCWTFEVSTTGITGASVRDSAGMLVAKLGMTYRPKSCATVPVTALALIESKPARYVVWLDTRGHPGDLRGKLFAGMAHM